MDDPVLQKQKKLLYVPKGILVKSDRHMLYHLMVGRRPLRHSKPILTSTYSFAVYEENEESKFE